MNYLYDKIFLIVFSMLPIMTDNIKPVHICALLSAVSAACLCHVINIKPLRTGIEICYFVICLVFPEFTFFAAAVFYDAVKHRDYAAAAFCSAALIKFLFSFGKEGIFILLLCALSAYCCQKSLDINKLKIENKKGRDNSTELERLMKKRNRELSENLEYEIRLTALNERNRIAREIHDNVGHLLSRSLLQTGALRAVCPDSDEKLKKGLDDLKETLNSAMNSIRESVHGIRDDSLDLRMETAKIVSPLKEKLQLKLDYDIIGEMPPKIKLCFIAILKEAVSNISRHSSGNKATVILREHPSMYQLIISDNGKGKISDDGMGISNMRERAENIGGNFTVTDKGGVCVFVSVKKQANPEQ